LILAEGLSEAQPAPTAKKSEAEFLVPPQGGAFQIPVHAGEVCILSFADKLSSKALASSPDFEIKSWGDDGVAVRAIGTGAKTTTLALSTATGAIKVNVTLEVVAPTVAALTLVRFKAASSDEAFQAQVEAAVAKKMAPIQAELAKARQNVDAQIRDRADGMIEDRLLKRNEVISLTSHERNDDHVIAHVTRATLLGDDGYIMFEIENRSSSAYRLATVEVRSDARAVMGPARLLSAGVDADPSVIGVVPAGSTARGVVVVRSADQVLGKSLTLELAGPNHAGAIKLDRGIVLK
jgi:hypothetical protein